MLGTKNTLNLQLSRFGSSTRISNHQVIHNKGYRREMNQGYTKKHRHMSLREHRSKPLLPFFIVVG